MLNSLPYEELLEDVLRIIYHDKKELVRQVEYFNKMVHSKGKSKDYLDRFEERLHHTQTRIEFFNQLLCRCQTYHFRCITLALEAAEKEAKKKGTLKKYGVFLFIDEGVIPEILIL